MVFHLTGLALLLIGYFTTIHQENELKNDIHTLVGCLLPSVSPGQELETNFLRYGDPNKGLISQICFFIHKLENRTPNQMLQYACRQK